MISYFGNPQQQRVELRDIVTVAEFVRERYLPHVMQHKRSWKVDEANFRNYILPVLGRLRLDEVTQQHVSELIKIMRERGFAVGTCNRALVVLQHAFNLARKWKIPGAGDNPVSGLSAGPDVPRQRFLTPEEAQRVIAAIAVEPKAPSSFIARFCVPGLIAPPRPLIGACLVTPRRRCALPQVVAARGRQRSNLSATSFIKIWPKKQFRTKQRKRALKSPAS